MEKQLLKVNEVCEVLSMSKSKVYVMMDQGELPEVRIGKSRRVRRSSLDAWIEKREQGCK